MDHKKIAGLIFCLCLTATVVAQTSSQSEDDGIGGHAHAGLSRYVLGRSPIEQLDHFPVADHWEHWH